jgi:hypothetical protein
VLRAGGPQPPVPSPDGFENLMSSASLNNINDGICCDVKLPRPRL